MAWSQQSIKSENKKRVLQTILEEAPVSRTAIAKKLGVTKGTVSSLATELINEKIIYELGPGSSSGGRRPLMLLFNEKAGYSIGLNLGVNYILAILTNLNGEIIAEQKEVISETSFDHILPVIIRLVQQLVDQAPSSPYGVIGIGVGVPGIVDNNGAILLAPNLHWHNVNLKEELEKSFQIPVTIENEANAGAYKVKKAGKSAFPQNIVYVSAGIGIGVGLIIDGKLYSGEEGFSGEMGHMMIDVNGRACSCGSQGCWEMYASEKAVMEESEKMLGKNDYTLEQLIHEAKSNNEAEAVFKNIGYYLGIGISNILNTFNPHKVVIGNRMALAKDLLTASVLETVSRHTLSYHKKNTVIEFSEVPTYSTALGASHFIIEKFFAEAF